MNLPEFDERSEINSANHEEYFPFMMTFNNNIVFFPHRYYINYLDDLLFDNDIDVEIKERDEVHDLYSIKMKEYIDDDVCLVRTSKCISGKFITLPASKIINSMNSIFLLDNSGKETNISIESLYYQIIRSFHADKWYSMLGYPITFYSKLINLTSADKQSIISSKVDINISKDLLNKLDKTIDKIKTSTSKNKVFVRLYSLSPKNPSSNINDLAVENTHELIKLLSNSPRAINSLSENYDNGIMLREFHEDLPTSNEFRLFVKGYCLRAISQYYCYEYLPELENDNIKKKIINWFHIVKNKIDYMDCVIDIVIWEDKEDSYMNLGIWIIEINSFGAGLLAGSSLFNWVNDYEILYNSREPVYITNSEITNRQNILL